MDSAAADATTPQRVNEMRIGVESPDPQPFTAAEVTEVLDAFLADWHVDPLAADDSGIWMITGRVDTQVGTPEYARHAHTLVQELLATGSVHRAEADLPVTAFVDPRIGNPESDVPPGSGEKRWARDVIRCDEAWAIEPGRGAGIRIGHPDTGYTLHPNLGSAALDLATDRDLIDYDDDALDPLVDPAASPWPLPFPGHGTTTASVMVGRGSEEDGIVGVAPGALVVPLRAVESVVQLFDSDVARAVEHARITGCHIVSISVGGKGFFGLRAAIQRAVDGGMIVMGAAGNNVRIVVAPASYPNCLAVAATGPDDQPWPESSRGRAVDVSAPGWGVHIAGYVWQGGVPVAGVGQSSGTSYAVTHLAGVAALWLAHHGPEAMRERYGSGVQAAFLQLLRSGGSRVPEGWDASRYGAGVVDAAAMLTAPLPATEELAVGLAAPAESPLARLSLLVNVDEAALEHALARQLAGSGEDLQDIVARFEGELAFHLIEDPEFRACLLGLVPAEPVPCRTRATCSPEFSRLFL